MKLFLYLLIQAVVGTFRPLATVRIGRLYNYSRIGHLAANTELYLRRQAQSKEAKLERHVFVTGPPANRQLLRMIKRRMTVIESARLVQVYDALSTYKPNAGLWIDLPNEGNEYYEFNKIPPQLAFTDDEEAQGQRLLAGIGVKPGFPYVCFHARDQAYLNSGSSRQTPTEWIYHDFRDSNIFNYLAAAEYLTSIGLFAVRMGAVVEQGLGNVGQGIIDYATKYRSDFGDIYLSARCKFFLCSDCGISSLPWIFNVPVAWVNVVPPIGNAAWRHTDVFIPKKLWSCESKRLLTFRETIRASADRWHRAEQYARAGLELIENTPEEILSLVKEMNQRLDGQWVTTDADDELQQRYRALIAPGSYCYGFPSRVGAEFLRQNHELLK